MSEKQAEAVEAEADGLALRLTLSCGCGFTYAMRLAGDPAVVGESFFSVDKLVAAALERHREYHRPKEAP